MHWLLHGSNLLLQSHLDIGRAFRHHFLFIFQFMMLLFLFLLLLFLLLLFLFLFLFLLLFLLLLLLLFFLLFFFLFLFFFLLFFFLLFRFLLFNFMHSTFKMLTCSVNGLLQFIYVVLCLFQDFLQLKLLFPLCPRQKVLDIRNVTLMRFQCSFCLTNILLQLLYSLCNCSCFR